MSKTKAKPYHIKDVQIVCPICKHDHFFEREWQLNTSTASFFGFDWANKSAQCIVLRPDKESNYLWLFLNIFSLKSLTELSSSATFFASIFPKIIHNLKKIIIWTQHLCVKNAHTFYGLIFKYLL
jgi:hypothetical protein